MRHFYFVRHGQTVWDSENKTEMHHCRKHIRAAAAAACALLLFIVSGAEETRAAEYPSFSMTKYGTSEREYSLSGVAKSTDAAAEQYNALINTLRSMAEAGSEAQNTLWDTGIVCGSYQEYKTVENALNHMLLCNAGDIILHFNEGFGRFETSLNMDGGYKVGCSTRDSAPEKYGHIYAGFMPGRDGTEVMRQQDAAEAVINSILQAAPAEPTEKCRYFNDWIANSNTYDWAGYNLGKTEKTSVYSAVCEGSSVCEGYARTFFVLCCRSGINCAYAKCLADAEDPESRHAFNAVNIDGRWKKTDVTWNDTDPGVRYTYFMVDIDDSWQEIINKPYCTEMQ